MTLHLYFSDAFRIPDAPAEIRDAQPDTELVTHHCPVILDAHFWPLQPWNDFLRRYSQNIAPNTAKAYGRDLFSFAKYLDQRGLHFTSITNDDFVNYRNFRFDNGLNDRSWQREVVVLRAFFDYLIHNNYLNKVPWHQVGRHSVLNPRNKNFDLSVRALTKQQWMTFKKVGLSGETLSGELDESFLGRHPLRDACAAELAITTGMRLQEWRSLLTLDFKRLTSGGQSITLEATTKGARRRTIYVPQSTWAEIDFYRRTERDTTIQKAQQWLRKNLETMAVVSSYESSSGVIAYRLHGKKQQFKTRDIPLAHRRLLVATDGDEIRPLSLFLGSTGKPPSQRAWHNTFTNANRRVWEAEESPEYSRVAVVPHDLRHTFSVVLLKNLQLKALQGLHNSSVGTGSISEHIVSNPLLTVQRLLGHASPATTMVYLRFIEDADALVQRAFEEWDDPTRDYADYVTTLLKRGNNQP